MPKIGELWAEIGARTEGLERGVAKATGVLDQFGRPLQSVQSQTVALDRATQGAAGSFGGLSRSMGGANTAVIALSGGIQDLPYGLRGVINNVQFTAQSFTQLVGSTGSARTAFAALGSALAGPAGILVAFSAATVALQLFSENAGDATDTTKELSSALDEAITLAGEGIKIEVDASEIAPALEAIEATIEGFDKARASLVGGLARARTLTLGVPGAENVQRDALEQALATLEADNETNKLVRERLRELQVEALTRERIAEAAERLNLSQGVGAGRARLGTSFTTPDVLERIADEDLRRFEAGTFDSNEVARRLFSGDPLFGPSRPGPVIDLSKFEALEDTVAGLTAGMEELRIDGVIETKTALNRFADDALKDLTFAIGDVVAELVIFGDTLSETLKKIGTRAVGSFVGGLVNLGVQGALAYFTSGASLATKGSSLLKTQGGTPFQGLIQRPSFDAASGLSARISLGDLVIEQQRSATRNNLNLVGLS